MKWVLYFVMICLIAGGWWKFNQTGERIAQLSATVETERVKGDPEERMAAMVKKMGALESDRTFSGIFLTFMSAGLVGIVLVVHFLPFFAQRLTHAIYDSGEMVERDVMHDARSLVAQGDYPGAIEAFKKAAAKDPLNRLPWVEISKIYHQNLHDPGSAIETIRHALQSQEWEVNDAAYFLFRLAEMHELDEGDRESAKAIMQQVVDEFPDTRHSANAAHKLHEWSQHEAGEVHEGVVAHEAHEGEESPKGIT